MKKSDLKTGMLCKYKNGEFALVINEFIVSEDGFMTLDLYSENLQAIRNDDYSIASVSEVLEDGWLTPREWDDETMELYLLWERKNEKTYEIDGIEYSLTTLRNIIKKAH